MTTALQKGLAAARHALDNGAVIISKEAHTVPAVTHPGVRARGKHLRPRCAAWAEPSHVARIDRGTRRRSSDEIAEALDARGVSLSVGANRHVMTVSCTCLSEDFEAMLELVGDIVMQPAFPAGGDREAQGRGAERHPPGRRQSRRDGHAALFAMLYPNQHPYGRPAKGSVETVEPDRATGLVAFHEARFAPSPTTAVIVGDVGSRARDCGRRARVRKLAQSAGSDVSARARAVRSHEAGARHPDDEQGAGRHRVRVHHHRAERPGYYAYTLMNNALGQYGIGGRLGDSIRERQGMAYYVFSSFDANVVEGPLIVRAGVNPANVDRAIRSIDEEMRRMAADGMTPEELADCKQYLDRFDSATARNQRRHRHVSADGGVFRSGARPRPAAAGTARRRDAGRRERGGAGGARRRIARALVVAGTLSADDPDQAPFSSTSTSR